MHIFPSPFKQGLCEDPDQDYLGLRIPSGSYLELGSSKNLAPAHPSLTSILFGKACQVPDCTEKWDGITQCDSQERFHRSQVFGETSQNRAMQTWPAIFPLNGGASQAGIQGHMAAFLIWTIAQRKEMPQGIPLVYIFFFFLVGEGGAGRGEGDSKHCLYLISQQVQGNWGLA